MSDPGVVPLVGVTESQLPDEVAAVAVKAMPEVPATLTVWAGGVVPVRVYAKFNELGLAESVGVADTTRVTFIVCGAAPVAAMVTVPL